MIHGSQSTQTTDPEERLRLKNEVTSISEAARMDLDTAGLEYIQAERILRVETPLGLDVLLPEKIEIRERVNGLFEMSLAVRSKNTAIRPEEIIGKLVDISLETGTLERRTWNGLVIRLSEGPLVTRGLRAYHLTIVPSHWKMTQNADNRIWMDKTAVEVAQILCQEHGLLGPKTAGIVREVRRHHYSVQMETDFAYLARRLEEAGIFYWFEHEGGEIGKVAATHRLVLANHEFGYQQSPDGNVRFAMGSSDRNHISTFTKTFSFVPGVRSATDWNFLTPNSVPRGDWPSPVELPGNGDLNLREFPMIAGYGTDSASEGIDNTYVEEQSRLRTQAADAEHNRVEGQSNVRTLAPGFRFKPYDVSAAGNEFEEHAILEIVHVARDRSYETNEGDPEYSNRFIAIPGRVPATPHRTTPKPRIDGAQIAIIAGPQGEEIHTDQHGRVKVWFPWDRRAKKDGSDTCWIRVMQNWGGPGWGTQVIPRIAMEAIISYLDGDPDKPIIQGLVPNPRQKVPYKLPENKTKSVFRTNTHRSKDWRKMNEMTFEDKEGNEEIFIHAERDRNEKTNNNYTERVDNNWVQSIGNSKAIEVSNNHHEVIGGSMFLKVGSEGIGQVIAGNVLTNIFGTGPLATHMKMPGIGSAASGDYSEQIQSNMTTTVGNLKDVYVGVMYAMNAGYNMSISSGSVVDINSGDKVGITASNTASMTSSGELHFVCGNSSIHLSHDGTICFYGKNLFFDISEETEMNSKKRVKIKSKRIDLNE